MNRFVFIGMLVGVLGIPAFADTFVFGVNSLPNHDYGTGSNTFTFGTTTFTAQGFNGEDLYSKTGGGDENGLGLTGDPTGDKEIYHKTNDDDRRVTQDFIQLDLGHLITAGYTNFSFSMASTTDNEAWSVSACHTNGVNCGTSGVSGTNESSHSLTGILSATNHYIDFSATEGNVLLHSLSATAPTPAVPEPGSIALLGTAFAAVLVGRRTKLRS